jgi:adenosylcobinamide-GDP ribazoletransferase
MASRTDEHRGLPPLGVFGAAQFLTRIPIKLRSAPDLVASVPWFPVVGACIGAVVGGLAAGLMEVLPTSVAAVVAVMVGVMITGAFHEDGLADTADALGGWTPAQRREILKDSRHGSYGVAAMVGTILTRVICVATFGPATACAGMIAAHTLGRGAAVAVIGIDAPIPEDGLGADYARGLSITRAVLGVTGAIAIAAVAVGWWIAPLAGAAALGAIVVAFLAHRAFGGISGDILGAVEQVAECLVLIVVSGLALHHQPWWA